MTAFLVLRRQLIALLRSNDFSMVENFSTVPEIVPVTLIYSLVI